MTVSVNPVQDTARASNSQLLAAALGVATDVYKIRMDKKAEDAKAEALAAQNKSKIDSELLSQQTEWDKNFAEVPDGTPHSFLGARPGSSKSGLFIPRSVIADRERREFDAEQNRLNRIAQARNKTNENLNELDIAEIGLAKTPDDAKKAKDSIEFFKNISNNLKQMHELRKLKGAEFLDRDAVADGGVLATDTKYALKELAKLGVLSKSDELGLAKLVPEDPLQVDVSTSTFAQIESLNERVRNKIKNFLDTRNIGSPEARQAFIDKYGPSLGKENPDEKRRREIAEEMRLRFGNKGTVQK